MDIEQFRALCLGMAYAVESTPFDDKTLAYTAPAPNGTPKIFALVALDKPTYALLKCDPETAIALRNHYPDAVEAGWHMNKTHWNGIQIDMLPKKMITAMVAHSHSLITASGARNTESRATILNDLIAAADI